MPNDREKISTGPNDRPLNETIAGTGPGIPDEALIPGKDLPEPPGEEEEKAHPRSASAFRKKSIPCRSKASDQIRSG